MALDRLKILNELGSVMNQLQSTDCGCMGKVFGNSGHNVAQPNQANAPPCGGYRQNCGHGHHHGCNQPPANPQFQQPYMNPYNAPKIYADTYNYLNKNLMQPTVKEVYNDIKDITPENTVVNHPIAYQMGFATESQAKPMANNMQAMPFQMEKQNIASNLMAGNNTATINPTPKDLNQHGLGPQIMNMYWESSNPNNPQTVPATNQQTKEPLLPARTTTTPGMFNTLGQPVEMMPAKMYHTPTPGLPQTLSPQVPAKPNFAKYSNVKSTMSKTSLMGNRPIGKTPSRNQLQHIYNQYKSSQSFTNQNVNNQIKKDISHSDGRLDVLKAMQMPIETVGGDTPANNRPINENVNKVGHVFEQIGDAPVVKQSDKVPEKSPVASRKYRNGLQDMVYTSYPSSAAWSFHGHGRAVPDFGYRYRNKI